MTEAAKQHLAQFFTYGSLLVSHEFFKTDGTSIQLQVVNFQSLLHASFKLGAASFNAWLQGSLHSLHHQT